MGLPLIFRLAQYTGFIVTVFTNSLLLYLLFFKTPKRIGQYLYMMIIFKSYCLFYAFVGILTQPVLYPTHSGIILYCDSFLKSNRDLGTYLSVIYCSGFGACIVLLTSLFMYKFIVIVRSDKLELIQGRRLVILTIPSLIVGVLWSIGLKLAASPNSQLNTLFGDELRNYYEDDISQIGYVATYFYVIDSSGFTLANYPVYLLSIMMSMTMFSAVFIVVYCGCRTFFKLDRTSIMSMRTKQMHQQLLLTLIIQAAIPFVTMFVPVFTLLILTTMSVNVEIYANFVPAFAAIYPGLAPLVSLFLVADFRNIVLRRVASKVESTTVNGKSIRI